MHYENGMLVVDPGEVVPGSFSYGYQPMWYGRGGWGGRGRGRRGGWGRYGGTFAGMGSECPGCATPVDPRSAPVWSNIYRLASAGALNKVPTRRALGTLETGSPLVYLLALGIPVAVISALFLMGFIKVD